MVNAFRTILVIVIACSSFALVAGCAKEPARVARPVPMTAAERTALAALQRRQAEIRTLRASGRIFVWDRGELVADLAVVVALPDSVRIETRDSLADVTMAAGADGRRAWVWLPAENKVYRGKASRSNLRRMFGIDWDIDDLAYTLAGLVEVNNDDVLEQVGAEKRSFAIVDKSVFVRMEEKRDLPFIVNRMKRKGSSRMPQYEVRFERYRDVSGIPFPRRIVAHVPGRGSRVIIEYDEVELNKVINETVFEAPR